MDMNVFFFQTEFGMKMQIILIAKKKKTKIHLAIGYYFKMSIKSK